MVYGNRGSKQHDSDAWSNKGIMLNGIDLGFDELFQTHPYYGAVYPCFPSLPRTNEQESKGRNSVNWPSFSARTTGRKNVAIITGDFNINGADLGRYADIRHTMDGLDMHELWAWDAFDHGPGDGLSCRFTDGDSSHWQRRFDAVCNPQNQADVGLPVGQFCADDGFAPRPTDGVGRFDYCL
jgi:hypothetical protein